MHQRSLAANPQFADLTPVVGPDGDAFFETDFTSFQVPPCKQCEGILKPDVVYFGDNVPRDRVEQAQQVIAESQGLLVIGSSLMVFSGFRFARQVHQAELELVLLNLGKTRADDLASLRLQTPIIDTLDAVNQQLSAIT